MSFIKNNINKFQWANYPIVVNTALSKTIIIKVNVLTLEQTMDNILVVITYDYTVIENSIY